MKLKKIETETEYNTALAYAESLMDAQPGSPEEDDLKTIVVLIEAYEDDNFPIGLPDPITAIEFRMDQQGLTRQDLVPYIGSLSKVSEVLNGKRALSKEMIRALHEGLGIPAEVLLGTSERAYLEHNNYPIAEMVKRGYFTGFDGTVAVAKKFANELLANLWVNFQGDIPNRVYCRNSNRQKQDEYAMQAWQARVIALASNLEEDLPPYTGLKPDEVPPLVALSKENNGPKLAQEWLHERGVALIILKHLPKTYLDGACFMSPTGRPIIALTLRHDRLDNFWFTLLHEVGHLVLHLEGSNTAFFDDTEHGASETDNPQEKEANEFAANLLIPEAVWREEGQFLNSQKDLQNFADHFGIQVAVVAGRWQWERHDFTKFSSLLGRKKVCSQLPETV